MFNLQIQVAHELERLNEKVENVLNFLKKLKNGCTDESFVVVAVVNNFN
jgi:hypothetical protein